MFVVGLVIGGIIGAALFGVPGAIIGGLIGGGMGAQQAEKIQANAYLAQKRRDEQGQNW